MLLHRSLVRLVPARCLSHAWHTGAAAAARTSWRGSSAAPFLSGQNVEHQAQLPQRAVAAGANGVSGFLDLGIPAELVTILAAAGLTSPTPAQVLALPRVFDGGDTLLRAETGGGKTLVYALRLLALAAEAPAPTPPGSDGAAGGGVIGLVLVPTQELARQVAFVLRSLAPPTLMARAAAAGGELVRAAWGAHGLSRREAAALLVATPAALLEHVSSAQLGTALRVIAVDEADALLTGSPAAATSEVLARLAGRRPAAARPQLLFCAATLPSRGQRSPRAWLERTFPSVLELATAGAHRPAAALRRNSFIQLDAALPLTLAEEAMMQRLAARAAAREAAARADLSGEAASAVLPASGTASADDIVDDPIAAAMAAREDEDKRAIERADSEAYARRVAVLRRHALLEALLLPLHEGDVKVDVADSSGAVTPTPAAATRGKAAKRRRLGTLLVSAPGAAAAASVDVEPAITSDDRAAVSPAAAGSPLPSRQPPASALTLATRGEIAPLTLDARGVLRDKIAAHEVLDARGHSRLPATLVFVNSGEAAEATRSALAAALPAAVRTAALHNGLPDDERARVLADFAAGRVTVLVCTDVAARGLDTRAVAHVIQAEFAQDAVAYLHRIGRTARAGAEGAATSLLLRTNADLARALAEADASGEPVDSSFSRNRSFRRKATRAVVSAGEERALIDALQREEAATAAAAAGGAAATAAASAAQDHVKAS